MKQNQSPKINPHVYRQLVFVKGAKNTHWKKVSSNSGARKIGYSHAKNETGPLS